MCETELVATGFLARPRPDFYLAAEKSGREARFLARARKKIRQGFWLARPRKRNPAGFSQLGWLEMHEKQVATSDPVRQILYISKVNRRKIRQRLRGAPAQREKKSGRGSGQPAASQRREK